MNQNSPSPVHLLSGRPSASTPSGSPRLGESERNCESPRTGLVTSRNGHRRSYGTVIGDHTGSFKKNNAFIIEHQLSKEDTLQGLALKYGVSVQEIARVNGVWSTESLFCKPHIKIPVSSSSSENSLSTSPHRSPDFIRTSTGTMEHDSRGGRTDLLTGDSRLLEEGLNEEVQSKTNIRRHKKNVENSVSASSAKCDESGVKNISEILNCADLQLKNSRLFMEKLAKKTESLSVADDAYHRTHEDREKPRSASLLPDLAKQQEEQSKSSRRFHFKRVETSPDKIEAHRHEVEDNLFGL